MQDSKKLQSLANRYEIPAFLQHFPLMWFGASVLLFLVIIFGSTQSWMTANLTADAGGKLMTGLTLLFLLSAIFFIRYWIVVAPYYVRVVEWDEEKILLHTQRGRPKDFTWYQISFAKAPRDTGEPASPYSHRLLLHILYKPTPYRIPWNWDDTSRAFLRTLRDKEKKVEEI
jgi:hypothetical protein